ncbi:hypothetical protein [Streptomyces sp. NPDC007088]|uniref:hypothetical protein n=1 Tax=Streptomyces sp. NPDC007088 TaxID=3364773 RepID=UPI0036ACA408
MRVDPTAPSSLGLSCYTENLALLLAQRAPGTSDLLARSVRLAVQQDTGHFSHHDRALDNLPGGRRLAYRGAPDATTALSGIADELTQSGSVLVVADSGALPWLQGDADDHAPHLILVDGHESHSVTSAEPHEGRTWHLMDAFSALFTTGSAQEPFAGSMNDAEFTALLRFPGGLSEIHRTRNALAFGFPVTPAPHETFQWLAEEPGTTQETLPGEPWLTDAAALEETARLLSAELPGEASRGVLEDVWAASRHHLFRDAHLLRSAGDTLTPADREIIDATTAKWRELPRMLRFAVNSARRGRPRPTLISGAFASLAEAEAAASPLHATHGYGAPTASPTARPHVRQGERPA